MTNSSKFRDAVAQVKLAYNIVDYIQGAGIQLRQQGMKWKGLCPFHSEKTPSFNVDEHFQNYRCFGCGASGDILAFVEQHEHLDFFEALRKLAEDKGIELQVDRGKSDVDYRSLRGCLRDAANFFYTSFRGLPVDHVARKEVADRNLDPTKFTYGYAPEGRQTLYRHLRDRGYSDETILQSGVCGRSEKGHFYDLWQGRLMFFVTDITGKPIGFSGRKLYETDRMGKYVNSPEGPLFNKSASLFNLAGAKAAASGSRTIHVAEGQFDVISMVEAGLGNAVASLGTAFTETQGMLCRRLVTPQGRIIFCFDGDRAGMEAAYKVFLHVPTIHDQAYVVTFPEGGDPCDYRMEHGSEALVDYVANHTMPLVEFVLSMTATNFDLDTPMGRSGYVEAAASVLRSVTSAPLREQFLRQVSLHAFTPIDVVRDAMERAKPITKPPTVVPEVAAPMDRSDLDETPSPVDEGALLDLVHTDDIHATAGRLIALTVMEPRFLPHLLQVRDHFPANLAPLVDELGTLLPRGTVVSEQFSLPRFMAGLLSLNLFPFAQVMGERQLADQFRYLRDYLVNQRRLEVEHEVSSRIMRILEESPNANVEFLSRALAKEGAELSQRLGVAHG